MLLHYIFGKTSMINETVAGKRKFEENSNNRTYLRFK